MNTYETPIMNEDNRFSGKRKFEDVEKDSCMMLATIKHQRTAEKGVNVVVLGDTGTGKSSTLNSLLGESGQCHSPVFVAHDHSLIFLSLPQSFCLLTV
jgi:predicted GTPase